MSSAKNCEPKTVYARIRIISQYKRVTKAHCCFRSLDKVIILELTPTVAIGRKNNVTVEIVSIIKLSCSMILLSCCTTRLKD